MTTKTAHRELGLTDHEYDLICDKLGREPNGVELAIFSLMWSEHCAYKHSKLVLRTLPTEGPKVVMGPGENAGTAWTSAYSPGQELTIVLKNIDGAFVADDPTLDRLEGEGRVVVKYVGNPNGSQRDIAGITTERGNIVGLMPHPEHAVEDLTGPGTDGLGFFTSLLESAASA